MAAQPKVETLEVDFSRLADRLRTEVEKPNLAWALGNKTRKTASAHRKVVTPEAEMSRLADWQNAEPAKPNLAWGFGQKAW